MCFDQKYIFKKINNNLTICLKLPKRLVKYLSS